MKRILGAVVMAFMSVFPACAGVPPETRFWQWFQANQDMLYEFEQDQERIFDSLADQLNKVDKDLSFEFGPKKDGKREFIISASGIRDAFPKVEALHAAAPALPNWTIVKFRPRRAPFDIRVGETRVNAADVHIVLHPQDEKVGLAVSIPGYTASEHTRYATIGYLFLDQALGEFDVETRVGAIQFQAPEDSATASLSLHELPAAFDAYFARQ